MAKEEKIINKSYSRWRTLLFLFFGGESELEENSVIRKFRIIAEDEKSYNTNQYSLEMIITVGIKVNSE